MAVACGDEFESGLCQPLAELGITQHQQAFNSPLRIASWEKYAVFKMVQAVFDPRADIATTRAAAEYRQKSQPLALLGALASRARQNSMSELLCQTRCPAQTRWQKQFCGQNGAFHSCPG